MFQDMQYTSVILQSICLLVFLGKMTLAWCCTGHASTEASVCQWANQSSRQLFSCKSSPLWLHYFTSVTFLQYS